MAFGSIEFLFYFLPILWFISGFIGVKKLLFIIFSLIFYTWGEGIYVLLLIGVVYFNYIITCCFKYQSYKKIILIAAIIINIWILVYFKYYGLLKFIFINRLHGLTNYNGSSDIHLPLGISFFLFQIISYLIDKYRGIIDKNDNFINVLLYISMFPHQLAGPIVRYVEIEKYLNRLKITTASFVVGLNIFIIGLSQKILIADTFSEIADEIFSIPIDQLSQVNSWIGAISYAIQIYFDFQGYSIMAAGIAVQFGIFFPRNFNWPYSSKSITEFWRKWHITLSEWFRDYVYIPLGGNRGGRSKTTANLLVVFILCGLWHGANLTFLLWGLYHGLFLTIERFLKGFGSIEIPSIAKHFYTLIVIIIGWVLFRAGTFVEAREYIKSMFDISVLFNEAYPVEKYLRVDYLVAFSFAVILSTPYPYNYFRRYIKWPECKGDVISLFRNSTFKINIIFYFLLFICIVNIIAGKYKPFIYFRF